MEAGIRLHLALRSLWRLWKTFSIARRCRECACDRQDRDKILTKRGNRRFGTMIRPHDEKMIAAGYEELAVKIHDYNGSGSARMKLRAARALLGLTQRDFADRFGVSLDTVKSWEAESRREPHGIARLLIEMISDNPIHASSIAERLSISHPAKGDLNSHSKKSEVL